MQDSVRQRAEQQQTEPAITGLAGYIERFWQAAQIAKRPIELEMLRNLRQRSGVYEPTELAMIREQGGSEIYMMLTAAKCRGAESWLREIILPDDGTKPWGLSPTPMPDLPPSVSEAIVEQLTQEALAAGWDIDDARLSERLMKVKWLAYRRMKELADQVAKRHELKVEDQFAEGGWEQALSDAIYDLVTFPAAILKGPIARKTKDRKWVPGPGGRWGAQVTDTIKPHWERRSPFDIFPAPSMRNIQHGGLIDRYRFTRGQLLELDGVEGYSSDAIHAVLEQYGMKGYNSRQMQDFERAVLELRPNEQYDSEGTIEAQNFHGSVPGYLLMEWQWKNKTDLGERIEPHKEYTIEGWKIARWVIKAAINENPMGKKPYYKASFEEIPGAFWGRGIPELMRDCQGMCNGAARAIANNAAIASGPQVDVDVQRIAEGETITRPYPWKLWQTTTDLTGNNQPAIRFSQPQMHVQELLTIFQHFDTQSDNITGFPKYAYGDSRVSGAGRTSSGLAQLLGNVGKGVRRVVTDFSRGIIAPGVTGQYDYNMQYVDDPTIKFDLRCVARGLAAVLMKDRLQQSRKEILQATMNPIDAQIMGAQGRAHLLRQTLEVSDLDAEKIVPDPLELELNMAGAPPMHELAGGGPGPNASGPPAGASPGGGSPEGPETVDAAGNRPNGVQQREMTLGYADGGVIRGRRQTDDADDGRESYI